jgi:6-phosphofructokinase 1
MGNNLLIVHGGGPTAVINSSLYGVITEALKSDKIDKVYGAIGGSEAVLKENFRDLSTVSEDKLKLLLTTPICDRIFKICLRRKRLCRYG